LKGARARVGAFSSAARLPAEGAMGATKKEKTNPATHNNGRHAML